MSGQESKTITKPMGNGFWRGCLAVLGRMQHANAPLARTFHTPVAADGSRRYSQCGKNAPTAVGGYILLASRAKHE
jgi:hypothetical protein